MKQVTVVKGWEMNCTKGQPDTFWLAFFGGSTGGGVDNPKAVNDLMMDLTHS